MLAALVTAGGTVLGALISLFGKMLFDQRAQYKIPKDRRTALTGTWAGKMGNIYVASDSPPLFETSISCTFVAGRKIIKGSGVFELADRNYGISLKGYLHDQHYIRLEYNHEGPVYAFGHILLRLNDHGTSMSGKAVGYGAFSGKIVVGTVQLDKRP